MSYQVLARKYRPQRFSEVIGQDHVTRTLRNAIEQQRIAHGYIFSGHRGIGKTTVARILAMALNCRSTDHPLAEPCGVCDSCVEIRNGNAVDVIEIDAATNRGIDEIRELREAARYRPARDRFKIYILDEAHQITDAAFNALLKTLEEPPPHIVFMMATTQAEDIPQTIRSRCQNFSFHAVRFEQIVSQLRSIAKTEGIATDEGALAMLAEAGDGSMRDALSIMDQAIASSGTTLSADTIRQLVGTVPSEVLEALLGAVEGNSSEQALRLLDELLNEGQNPAHFARQLVRFLRNAIVVKVGGASSSLLQISQDEIDRVSRVAEKFSEEDLTRFLQIMLRTHGELSYRPEQRFHLELGVLKMVHAQRLLPVEQLLSGAAASAGPGKGPTSSQVEVSRAVGSRPEGGQTLPAAPSAPSPLSTLPQAQPQRAPKPSPFEADIARKGGGTRGTQVAADIVSGSSALAIEPLPQALVEAQEPEASPVAARQAEVQRQVLTALENAGQKMLVDTLETGSWAFTENELAVTVNRRQSLLDAALNADARQVIQAAVVKALGRPLRMRLISGAVNGAAGAAAPAADENGQDARSRAVSDPVVRRMREKFGAEIRTVVDHRDKNGR
ncbi:MAG TPA: DNA polymerase III subunit gamma/tau [Terriglobales bacterium]|nr:DNA polymerase III subunit gamma/tau [Terriglobales bacterium]